MRLSGATVEDRRIRSLRSAKPSIDPRRALGTLREPERTPEGELEQTLTIFLAGRECPFTCIFCDLWRHTLDEATPEGSLPTQIQRALEAEGQGDPPLVAVKLYNASNFFDPLAVPDADLDRIVQLVSPFARVTVESHPLLVGRRCFALARDLEGGLEVAMGLETAHPEVLSRLNKKMDLQTFERAAGELQSRGIGVRAFVLVGVPFLPGDQQVEWAVRSVEHAVLCGAERVALIPVRGGNGEMERLRDRGDWEPPTLGMLETAFDVCVESSSVAVTVDTWDLDRFRGCEGCHEDRVQRLREMNLTGRILRRPACDACGTEARHS